MFLKMLLENRFTLTYGSDDFLILFVTFWKLICSQAVTPRWLGNAKECIQSGWSKQRDSCSLANEISAADAGHFDSCISRNYLAVSTWILNGSSIECHVREEASTFQFILCSIWMPGNSNFWVKICLALEESKIIERAFDPFSKLSGS